MIDALTREGSMRNWSQTVEFGARAVLEPDGVDALCEAVAAAPRIRAFGTRHSFNAIADTDGVLVAATAIPPAFELDEARRLVRFGAGTRYAALAAFLTDAGWALHNMGSLPHISVGGAVATGTHGSGARNGSLATAVRGLQVVGADGGLRWVRHGDADFPGSVVALGALGVVVRIELAIQPTYLVRQDVYTGLDWEVFLADVPAVTDLAYSVSVFTDWLSPEIGQVWVKRRVESADEPVPDELLGAPRATAAVQIIESADDNTTQQGVAGAWSAALPHFRIDSTPSAGDEIQSEYFVDRADAAAALTAVRELAAEVRPLLLITELRTIAADELWLSEAYRRDSLAIHFTWRNEPDAVLAQCRRVEAALAPFAPRPHWGKVHGLGRDAIEAAYPRLDDFRALRRRVDPDGKFGGPELDRLIGGGA